MFVFFENKEWINKDFMHKVIIVIIFMKMWYSLMNKIVTTFKIFKPGANFNTL